MEQVVTVSAFIRVEKPLKLKEDDSSRAKEKPVVLSKEEQERIMAAM